MTTEESLLFQCSADFHCNLPMGDFAFIQMGAGLGYFQPAEVLLRSGGFGDRVSNRILNAHGGGTDHFDFFVNMCAHKRTIAPLLSGVQYGSWAFADTKIPSSATGLLILTGPRMLRFGLGHDTDQKLGEEGVLRAVSAQETGVGIAAGEKG